MTEEMTLQEAWDAYEIATYGKTGNTFHVAKIAVVSNFLIRLLLAQRVDSVDRESAKSRELLNVLAPRSESEIDPIDQNRVAEGWGWTRRDLPPGGTQ